MSTTERVIRKGRIPFPKGVPVPEGVPVRKLKPGEKVKLPLLNPVLVPVQGV